MNSILDVMIGTIYVYLFFSIFCSGITEWISRLRKLRAKVLQEAMSKLLASSGAGHFAGAFHSHPLIMNLTEKGPYPTYIPSLHFALAFMDLAVDFAPPQAPGAVPGPATIKPNLNTDGKPGFTDPEKQLVNSLIVGLNSPGAVQTRLEQWFNDAMERVSGWYKRRTYSTLMIVSLLVSLGFGVDTFRLANGLYRNNAEREAIVKKAQAALDKATDPMKADVSLKDLAVPIGWSEPASLAMLGCLVTAFALTLGAPFWFDLLGRLVNLRQTGVPPDLKGKIVAH